jgi:phosphoglycerol transferase MdoB-like AlkP superfamily enzyme
MKMGIIRFFYVAVQNILQMKIFIAVLGVDTHLPKPRSQTGYGDLVYPKNKVALNGTDTQFEYYLKSINNHDYDMNNFINKFKQSRFYTANTLIAITADHNIPLPEEYMPNRKDIIKSKNFRVFPAKIPFVLISKSSLPRIQQDAVCSQIDIAPTLIHLLGFDPKPGWWGTSLFAVGRNDFYFTQWRPSSYFVSTKEKHFFVDTQNRKKTNKTDIQLFNLFNSIIVD